MPNIKQILADNVIPILIGVFCLGGVATTITVQGWQIGGIQESMSHYVTKEELSLKERTLTNELEAINDHIQALENRVRRKLDGQLKDNSGKIRDLEIGDARSEAQLEQAMSELNDIWAKYNELLKRIK